MKDALLTGRPRRIRDRQEQLLQDRRGNARRPGKTAYSPILKSAGDYSCGVFDAKGAMVAQGPDLPIHLGSHARCRPRRGRRLRRGRARRRRVHPQRPLLRRQPSARRQRGAPGLPRGSPARLRLPARALARRRLGHARQLRRRHGDLRRGPAPAAAAARQPRRHQHRPREGDPRQRAHARRAQGRPRCPAGRHAARDRAPGRAGQALRHRRDHRRHVRGDGLFRAADARDARRPARRRGHFRGLLRRRWHPRRRAGARRAVLDPHAREEGRGSRDGRLRRQRSRREGPHQRAAVRDSLGHLLRAQDRGRPQQPHTTQLRVLANDRGEGAQGLGGERPVPLARRLRQPRDLAPRCRHGDGRAGEHLAHPGDGLQPGHLGGRHVRRRRSALRPALRLLRDDQGRVRRAPRTRTASTSSPPASPTP